MDRERARLADGLGFDLVDLEANRRGELSAAQRERLTEEALRRHRSTNRERTAKAAFWVILPLTALGATVLPQFDVRPLPPYAYFILAAALGFLLTYKHYGKPPPPALFDWYIECVEGAVATQYVDGDDYRAGVLHVYVSRAGDEDVDIKMNAKESSGPEQAFIGGGRYRLYCLATRDRILSAEPLSAD